MTTAAVGEVIDLARAIGLAETAKLLRGRGGRPPDVATVRRWANPKRGCWPQGRQGRQLLLRTVRFNGELLTMPEWAAAFEAERVRLGQRGASQAPPSARQTRPASRRAAAHRRAEKRLAEKGVGGA